MISSLPLPSAPSHQEISILLVDDQVRNLEVLESILHSSDYRIVRVTSGAEALLALMKEDFAVIVLDIEMPELNGIELARLIKQRKRNCNIPILFLTAYFQEDTKILEGYTVGAVDYLTKPVTPQILRSKIEVFVQLFRANRALAHANSVMEQEIVQRKDAQEALRKINDELESRVRNRTDELMRAKETAERASKAKDEFLAALSHELRTPLNPALLLASEREGDDRVPAEIRKDFAIIRQEIELEARLIDDLLDLTRIAQGKLCLAQQTVELHTLIHASWRRLRAEAESKELEVCFQLAGRNPWIEADEVRLQQVFWNIMRNAVRFTPAKGRILIRSQLNDTGGWQVEVADSGMGIEQTELERIFRPFEQGEGGHRFGGLGLGLSISQRLIELHGGRITATSEGRDRGAVFSIHLPVSLVRETGPHPISSPPERGPAATTSRRILLVEDHIQTRTTLARLLTQRGHQVATADSMQEALERAQTFAFDLLLSDLGLPDASGHDLVQELRKYRREFKGVALSGYGMEGDVRKSLEAGFQAHLTKPIDMKALDQILNQTGSPALDPSTPTHLQ